MYANHRGQQILPGDFFLPFGGRLSEDNRWVQLAYIIPWRRVEQEYSEHFSEANVCECLNNTTGFSERLCLKNFLCHTLQKLSEKAAHKE